MINRRIFDIINVTKKVFMVEIKEINKKYFSKSPAMLVEFKNIIKNLNEYI